MIYVFLADGFEETEAIAPIDCLRRCGKDVTLVGIGKNEITSSHGVTVKTDITDKEISLNSDLEMIVLPGGMPGTLNLEKSSAVQTAIDFCDDRNKYIAAICAAPSILGHKGLLNGKRATCYTGFEVQLEGAEVTGEPVCVDGNIITARGAGVSLQFGIKLCEIMTSAERAKKLFDSMLCE